MKTPCLTAALVCLCLFTQSDSAQRPVRLLMVLLPGTPSHNRYLHFLGEGLAARGIDVTLLAEQHDASHLPVNKTRIVAYYTPYSHDDWRAGARAVRFSRAITTMARGFEVWTDQADRLLKNNTMMTKLRASEFDAVVGDMQWVGTAAVAAALRLPFAYISAVPIADPIYAQMFDFPNNVLKIPQVGCGGC
jgi:hypothetical protein